MRAKSAPSITRVHTLHRIRTVVNHVTQLFDAKVPVVDDLAIADHLIRTHLSKATTKKIRDQIGRRARDHLETARYLGLLYRRKNATKFTHIPSTWGRRLARYKIHEECPSEPLEEAILVDRICRLKLANTSYQQEPAGLYTEFRSRLCLLILASLKLCGSLNIFQIGSILANTSLDVTISPTRLARIANRVSSTKYGMTYLNRLRSRDKRNIRRDTQPFVDWCEQLGLLEKLKETDTIAMTGRGSEVLEFYTKGFPVWWSDLGQWGELAAAAMLLTNYLKLRNRHRVIRKLAKTDSRSGLFPGNVGAVLREVTGCTMKRICDTNFWFDFSRSYDVPPDKWELVEQRLLELMAALKMTKTNVSTVVHAVEWGTVRFWREKFKHEADQASQAVSGKLNIKATVPTVSIQYHFQSDYEATTYVLLQHLQKRRFSVAKYQGQLVEYFADDPHWRRVATSNPDLLVTDGFLSLVECKSVKEWGPKLTLTKPIIGELLMYGQFAAALTSKTAPATRCRVMFSYEGEIDRKDWGNIEGFLLQACPGVIIVLRSALQKALVDNNAKKTLRSLVSLAPGFRDLKKRILG